jgi:predicted nucleotidyltransferase component of viral defense system
MALEQRLNIAAQEKGMDIMRLRRQVAFDRFLARIFHTPRTDLIVKGGYTLELRMQRARTTKDIDFSFVGNLEGAWAGSPDELKIFFQDKLDIDLRDFFTFVIGDETLDLENAPYGGFRFPIEAKMGIRKFVAFSIDVAAGDCWFEPHESASIHDWFGSAGIPTAKIPIISLEQQFAEKLHSYTRFRDYENSRVKDLLDMVLLINDNKMIPQRVLDITEATFKKRDGAVFPPVFHVPPGNWKKKYIEYAKECGIEEDIMSAVEKVRSYCSAVGVLSEN